jgi:DNA-binding response OmpR family regulator
VAEDDSLANAPHVLIVDDDGTSRMIASGVMQKAGFRVSEACDGAEALVRLARGEHFSLMILDLDMPNLGGRDVLRLVRQSIATVGLPVVVLTGSPDPAAELELMEMGADDYLRKPIDPPLLSIRVKAAMRRIRG